MPYRNRKHLRFEGAVIGRDDEGVMLELTGAEGSCRMFAPYAMLGDELMNGMGMGTVVDVEVNVGRSGDRVSLTMALQHADQT